MKCSRCKKEIKEGQEFTHEGRILCEDCRIHAGLYPLGHTGQYKRAFNIKDRKR